MSKLVDPLGELGEECEGSSVGLKREVFGVLLLRAMTNASLLSSETTPQPPKIRDHRYC